MLLAHFAVCVDVSRQYVSAGGQSLLLVVYNMADHVETVSWLYLINKARYRRHRRICDVCGYTPEVHFHDLLMSVERFADWLTPHVCSTFVFQPCSSMHTDLYV